MECDSMARNKPEKEVRRAIRLLKKRGTESQKEFAERIAKFYDQIKEFKPIDVGTIENGAWKLIAREMMPVFDQIETGYRLKNLKDINDPVWVDALKTRLEEMSKHGKELCEKLDEESREYHIVRREIADLERAISIVEEARGEEIFDRLADYLVAGYVEVKDPEKEFKEVLEVNPDDYSALVNLMAFFDRENRVDELIEVGGKITSRYPEDLLSRAKLIEGMIKTGAYDEALKLAEEGVELAIKYNEYAGDPETRYLNREEFDNLIWRVNEIMALESAGTVDTDSDLCAIVAGGEVDEIVELGEDAIPYLRSAILRGDPISLDAPEILSKIGGDSSKRVMIDGIKVFDEAVIGAFVDKIVESGEDMLPFLKEELTSSESYNRRNRAVILFNCLAQMKGVEGARDLLTELLNSEDEDLTGGAAVALGYLGDKSVIDALRDAKERVDDQYKNMITFAIALLEQQA
ncbi:hypothetical protein DRN98_04185 [Methanosarcinales archaeon]|nr:MAG: hypothetical protein DRN98_04185 [Methanosarcinales archaeon]